MVFEWKIPPTVTWSSAFCFAAVLACFLAYRDERRRALDMEARMALKITIECGTDVPGSRPPLNCGVQALRLVIHSQSTAPINNCRAYLVKIEHDLITRWGDNKAALTFAPAERYGTGPKTIHPDTPEYVDVIFIHDDGWLEAGILPGGWNYERTFQEILADHGTYFLTVQVVGDMPTETSVLRFTRSGSPATSRLEKAG
jgi:hypothetical protein